MARTIGQYVKLIQPLIAYCWDEQPRDGGSIFWIFGDQTNLDELFDEYGVPEEMRDELAENLQCACGTWLTRYDDIGLKPDYEVEYERKVKKWASRYGGKFADFTKHLEAYPSLGGNHPMGSIIYRNITNFPRTEINNEYWFRARRKSSDRKFSIKDILPPDPSVVPISEGRFNHLGQCHFHLGSTEETAALEVLGKGESKVVMLRIKIIHASDILDLRHWGYGAQEQDNVIAIGILTSGVLETRVDRSRAWKPEYFIPRYIADCAKHRGYKGIVYQSSRYVLNNLVIFEPDSIKYDVDSKPYDFKITKMPEPVNFEEPIHPPFDFEDLA